MYLADLVDDVWETIKKIESTDGASFREVVHALEEVDKIEHALEDDEFEDSLPQCTRFLAEEVSRILRGETEKLTLSAERPLTS